MFFVEGGDDIWMMFIFRMGDEKEAVLGQLQTERREYEKQVIRMVSQQEQIRNEREGKRCSKSNIQGWGGGILTEREGTGGSKSTVQIWGGILTISEQE